MANLDPWRHAKAFTVVELLVVVAILSLLMAVLLPGLNKARILARRVVCQSNLRGIAFGYLNYLNDNEGRFYGDNPRAKNPHYTFGGWYGRTARVSRRPVNAYLDLDVEDTTEQDARIFRCPSDKHQDPNAGVGGSFYAAFGNSYQANLILVRPRSLEVGDEEPWATINERIRTYAPATQGTISEPSRQLWIGDHAWYAQWDTVRTPPACTRVHGRRHYHCIVFLDGHCQFVEIIKGIYETKEYRIQPHQGLDEFVRGLHRRKPCSCEL